MKLIIVVIDDSLSSDRALTTALRLGRERGAHVTAIVIRDASCHAASSLESKTTMVTSQAQRMGVEADAMVRRGSASTVIASLADEFEALFLVVPEHLVDDLRRGLVQRAPNAASRPIAVVVPHELTIGWRHMGGTASSSQGHDYASSSLRPRDAAAASAPASARRAARPRARLLQGAAASTRAQSAAR
jgi:hypothetical protein